MDSMMYIIEAIMGIGIAVSLLALNVGVKGWCWRYLQKMNSSYK